MADKNVVVEIEDDSTFTVVKQKPRKAKEPEVSKPVADKKKKPVRPLYKDFSKPANGKQEPAVQDKAPRTTTCYNCQGEGHLAKDCKEEKKPRNVNKDAASSESNGTAKRVPICYNCKKEGHVIKDCPEERKPVKDDRVCYKCNETGHIATKCPSAPPKPQVEVGSAPVVVCHKCNAQGHLSKDCPQKKPAEVVKCYRCDQPGHTAYNCPKKSQNRR